VGQLESQRLDLGLGGVEFSVAQRDLPTRFGGIVLCLIDELLNGVGDPI